MIGALCAQAVGSEDKLKMVRNFVPRRVWQKQNTFFESAFEAASSNVHLIAKCCGHLVSFPCFHFLECANMALNVKYNFPITFLDEDVDFIYLLPRLAEFHRLSQKR